jgi:lysophospholipase L1-like esterase
MFTSACNKLFPDSDKGPTAPSGPPAAGSPIVYTAVGASDANGIGSSFPCVPFTDCPNGKGYVPVAAGTLKSQGFTVTLRNLGIPTAVIGPDFQSLGRQYGRTVEGNFIDQEMPFVLPTSTLVTIFAGGNEVNTVTAALGGGAGAADPIAYIDAQASAFGADYATLLTGVRDRAPSARVVAVNVPNMAGLPYLASAASTQRQAAQRAAVAMNRAVNALVSQGVIVIDVMCDTRSYQASNYSPDGLHPNDAGHAFLADEIVRAVTSTSYPAPQASCASMAVVP